jgi:hypothetical protein
MRPTDDDGTVWYRDPLPFNHNNTTAATLLKKIAGLSSRVQPARRERARPEHHPPASPRVDHGYGFAFAFGPGGIPPTVAPFPVRGLTTHEHVAQNV